MTGRKARKKATRKATRKAAKKTAKKTASRPVKKAASGSAAEAAKKTAGPVRRKAAAKPAPRPAGRTARERAVKPIPDGYHTATPYLIVKGAAAAIDFYRRAFGAAELLRFADPSGHVGHAEVRIGDSVIMLADEVPGMDIRGPQSRGGATASILLYVLDVDARFARAVAAGAKVLRPVVDQFYGDRSGTLEDPFGHQWSLATHKEDVAPEEMHARFEAFAKQP